MPKAASAPRIAEPEMIHHPDAWTARTSDAELLPAANS